MLSSVKNVSVKKAFLHSYFSFGEEKSAGLSSNRYGGSIRNKVMVAVC